MIVLIALSTGMRSSEVFRLSWTDVLYAEGLIAVRAKLKGGKMRYVPMPPELAGEVRRYAAAAVNNDDRIFPPEPGATSGRQRLEGSFEDLLRTGGHTGLPVSRSASHLRVLVHDERGRSVRAREDSWAQQYQDDRTLRKAGAAAYCQDQQHRSGNLEANGAPTRRAMRTGKSCVRVWFAQLKLCVSGYL